MPKASTKLALNLFPPPLHLSLSHRFSLNIWQTTGTIKKIAASINLHVAIPEARLLVRLKAIDSLTGKKEKAEEKLSETIKATKVTGDLWLNVKMTLQLSSRVEAFRKQFITREPLKVYIIKCKGYEEGKSNDDSDA
ncbi:hypothetical protein Tco_0669924 [Tanacetum coccineum]